MIYFLLILFTGCIILHLLYWLCIFLPLKPDFNQEVSEIDHGIISCFKNEEKVLSQFVELIQEQRASEIILVDDFSTDGSSYKIKITDNTRLKSCNALDDRPGKKNALLTGVKTALSEFIVLTDVDCRPASRYWSTIMASELKCADAVLGYGPMTKSSGIIATFSRYETYLTGIQYLSYAQKGLPYMGVGRNMAIKKSVTLPYLISMNEDQLASGDDDMLIQNIAKENGIITTCLDPQSFVYSESPNDVSSYIAQKSRHISTSTSYMWKHKFLLGAYAGTHIASYLLVACIVFYYPSYLLFAMAGLLLKWMVQFIVNYKLMDILKEKDLLWKTPILDIATFAYYIVLTPYLILRNKKKWS